MITAVVFSKDRPMQLDALLSSLEVNAPGVFDVGVLFVPSNGYKRCMDYHLDGKTRWMEEWDFRADVLDLIGRATERICFFVDDDIMYSAMPPSAEIRHPPCDWASFSLRLGVNTRRCYPHDAEQWFPASATAHYFGLVWPWREGNGDTAYPLSLDGHIMETALIQDILKESNFDNPNQMEDKLAWATHGTYKLGSKPYMACAPSSCVVNVPANRVTATHDTNRVMDAPAYSPEALNDMFLDGWRIDWQAMDYSNVDAAHCELTYVFAKDLAQ